ncbi:MAG: hypothetical protein K0B81_01005 [Candidatus Cloacimonetes bacterium]|nr:hypothetical protein [Candidatus Cloacimonadota bacterium]
MKINRRSTLLLSIVILMIALLIIACDRFDNSFQPAEEDISYTEHLNLFSSTLFESLSENNISAVMNFYSEDYLNDGLTKSDVEIYFTQLAEIVTEDLSITIEDHDQAALSFRYRIEDSSASIDTLIVEYTLDKNAGYLLIGNQQTPEEPEEMRVLVELFTATWCPNCPYVEAALHDLKQLYGNRFYYIEYHIMDALDIGNMDILNYYQLSTALPKSIIQGSMEIPTGSPNSYDEYNFAISSFLNQYAEFFFEDFNYAISDGNLSFQVRIATESLDLTDLQLKYALIEKETDVNNAAGQPCRNVVFYKDAVSLTPDMFNVLVTEDFILPEFSFTEPRLVVWLQTIEDVYDSETCIVHNVIEYEIVLP